jgi:hypothetical protein
MEKMVGKRGKGGKMEKRWGKGEKIKIRKKGEKWGNSSSGGGSGGEKGRKMGGKGEK